MNDKALHVALSVARMNRAKQAKAEGQSLPSQGDVKPQPAAPRHEIDGLSLAQAILAKRKGLEPVEEIDDLTLEDDLSFDDELDDFSLDEPEPIEDPQAARRELLRSVVSRARNKAPGEVSE